MNVHSGVRWSAVSAWGQQAIQFGIGIVLARLLLPQDYGLLAMASVFVGLLALFKTMGFGSVVVQRRELTDGLLSSLFYANLAVACVLTVLAAGAAPVCAWIYDDPRLAPIMAVMGVNFVFSASAVVPSALLTRHMRFERLAFVNIGSSVVGGATGICMAFGGFGVWALVGGSIAGTIVDTALLHALCTWHPRLIFRWSEVRSALGFGANITGFNIFNYFSRNADNFIIGTYLGAGPLGFYSLAYGIMLKPRDAVTNVLTRVLFPAFSRMQNDDSRLAEAYLRACGAIAFLTFPMMAGFAVVAGPFVEVVLGDKWLPAVPLIWILAPVGALQSLASVRSQVLLAKGRADWYLRWGVCGSLVTLGSFVVGIFWGLHGVAFAYCAVTVPLTLASHLLVMRLLPGLTYLRFLRALAPHVAASAGMAAVVHLYQLALPLIPLGKPLALASSVLVGVGVYALWTLLRPPPVSRDFKALVLPLFPRLRAASSRAQLDG